MVDYIRMVINLQEPHKIHDVLENLKKAEVCTTLRELAGRYLSIITNKPRFNCDYCDTPETADYTHQSRDRELNYDLFGILLQYVICLLPCLVQKKDNQQVQTMLERTAFYFETQLNDVKRLAFMTNLFVHCQYDLKQTKRERNEILRAFLFTIWKKIRISIDLTVPNNNEFKLYFLFGGIFMVDVLHRTCYYRDWNVYKKNLKQVKLNGFDDFKQVLDALLDHISNKTRERSRIVRIATNVNQRLKLRVFIAVGGQRLYRKVFPCENSVIKFWIEIIKQLGFDYTSVC